MEQTLKSFPPTAVEVILAFVPLARLAMTVRLFKWPVSDFDGSEVRENVFPPSLLYFFISK